MSIHILGVSKRFKPFTALDNVGLHINGGELPGPAGSGKTALPRAAPLGLVPCRCKVFSA